MTPEERPGPARSTPGPGELDVHRVLLEGEMEVHGRIAGSSNATLLVTCRLDDVSTDAIYKPVRGERPLWDFPSGLHRREVAAYRLSRLLGWDLVPETVDRPDGPFGPGSVQRFVDEDGVSHYFTLRENEAWHATLVALAAFDVVVNNADRKSGHVLLAEDRLWAIDNGLCFHCEPKLRTVIWDFAGEPLPEQLTADLSALFDGDRGRLVEELADLLDHGEMTALVERASVLLDEGALPAPDEDGRWPPYPWPLV